MSRFQPAVPLMLARGLCPALVAELRAINSGSSTCTVLPSRTCARDSRVDGTLWFAAAKGEIAQRDGAKQYAANEYLR
jgi:hypothetical protein